MPAETTPAWKTDEFGIMRAQWLGLNMAVYQRRGEYVGFHENSVRSFCEGIAVNALGREVARVHDYTYDRTVQKLITALEQHSLAALGIKAGSHD